MTINEIIVGSIGVLISLTLVYVAWKLFTFDANHNRKPGPLPAEALTREIDRISQIRMTRTEIRRIKKLMKKNPKTRHLVKQ